MSKQEFLIATLFFVTLPAFESKLRVIEFPRPTNQISEWESFEPINKRAVNPRYDYNNVLLMKLLNILKQNQKASYRNRCLRLFGSIYGYGSRKQRLLCWKKMKSKRTKEFNVLEPHYPNQGFDSSEYYFDDSANDRKYPYGYYDSFSTDYVDLDNLRSKYKNVLSNWYARRNDIIDEASDSDSTDTDSEKARNEKVTFVNQDTLETIDNELKTDDSSEDGENTDNKSKTIDSAETNELYIQGNRLVVPRSSRRRLPIFLPKRFHWNDDEIHNLGYYWFNGPQGRYPNQAVRP